MTGLRIVLGAYPVPGPWREACKGVYYVKGLKYVPARSGNEGSSDLTVGMNGTQSELIEWTGQASAPVVAWNDERPRSSWIDQLNLAERLAPEPPLTPADVDERARMFGLANELLGENGLVWAKRLLMVDAPLKSLGADDPQRAFWIFMGEKYGYSPAAADRASQRIADVVSAFAKQLSSQQARGQRYLVGDRLSAVDIYWAACCGILDPMPPERCPMADGFRGVYGNTDPRIEKALTRELRAHRDFIYDEHLEMPVVF
jgi:glutathione S-transferase